MPLTKRSFVRVICFFTSSSFAIQSFKRRGRAGMDFTAERRVLLFKQSWFLEHRFDFSPNVLVKLVNRDSSFVGAWRSATVSGIGRARMRANIAVALGVTKHMRLTAFTLDQSAEQIWPLGAPRRQCLVLFQSLLGKLKSFLADYRRRGEMAAILHGDADAGNSSSSCGIAVWPRPRSGSTASILLAWPVPI